jgi:hypothetical protein
MPKRAILSWELWISLMIFLSLFLPPSFQHRNQRLNEGLGMKGFADYRNCPVWQKDKVWTRDIPSASYEVNFMESIRTATEMNGSLDYDT